LEQRILKIKNYYRAINQRIRFIVSIFIFCSCGSEDDGVANASLTRGVEFEYLDSVVVETLMELFIADKDENSERLLFNEMQMKEFFVTDMKGKIISQIKLKGEGPNEIPSPSEIAFYKDGLLVKESSAEIKFNFYDKNFIKTGQSQTLAQGIYFMGFLNSAQSFSVVEKEKKNMIIGYEYNMLNDQLKTREDELGVDFYEKAEMGYLYLVDTEELFPLNLYPESWQPRVEQKWMGFSLPFLQLTKSDQVVAVLPRFGNQMFYYNLNDTTITPLTEINLIHPERNVDESFDFKQDDKMLYPFFSRLMGGGEYFLVEFHTAFPREIYETFQAKNKDFKMDPEFWEAIEKHHKANYILTDSKGNQAPIAELPISGVINYLDADDVLYIKPITETELDYNVFYRYKVSLK